MSSEPEEPQLYYHEASAEIRGSTAAVTAFRAFLRTEVASILKSDAEHPLHRTGSARPTVAIIQREIPVLNDKIPLMVWFKPNESQRKAIAEEGFFAAWASGSKVDPNHPMIGLGRCLAELDICEHLKLMAHDRKALLSVVDVGSNIQRIETMFRVSNAYASLSGVHHLVPLVEPGDTVRNSAIRTNKCNHKFTECNCKPFHNADVLIFQHSLYYVKPEQLLERLVKGKVAFATVHHAWEASGTIFGSEMCYHMGPDGLIHAKANGNNYEYVHPPNGWLKEGYFVDPRTKRTLVWEKLECRFGTYLYKFWAVEAAYAPPAMRGLLDPMFVGDAPHDWIERISLGLTSFNVDRRIGIDHSDLSVAHVTRVDGISFLYGTAKVLVGHNQIVALPVDLLGMLASLCVNVTRDAMLTGTLSQRARYALTQGNYPPSLMPRAISIAVVAAMCMNLAEETARHALFISKNADLINLNRDVREGKPLRPVRFWDKLMHPFAMCSTDDHESRSAQVLALRTKMPKQRLEPLTFRDVVPPPDDAVVSAPEPFTFYPNHFSKRGVGSQLTIQEVEAVDSMEEEKSSEPEDGLPGPQPEPESTQESHVQEGSHPCPPPAPSIAGPSAEAQGESASIRKEEEAVLEEAPHSELPSVGETLEQFPSGDHHRRVVDEAVWKNLVAEDIEYLRARGYTFHLSKVGGDSVVPTDPLTYHSLYRQSTSPLVTEALSVPKDTVFLPVAVHKGEAPAQSTAARVFPNAVSDRIKPPIAGLTLSLMCLGSEPSCCSAQDEDMIRAFQARLGKATPDPPDGVDAWAGLIEELDSSPMLQGINFQEFFLTQKAFNSWVNRFPEKVRERYIAARETLRETPLRSGDCNCSGFIKQEKSVHLDSSGIAEANPRMICAYSDRRQVTTGPYHKYMARQMREYYAPKVGNPVVWVNGAEATADTMGVWFDAAVASVAVGETVVFSWGDQEKFEAHRNAKCWSFCRIVHRRAGRNDKSFCLAMDRTEFLKIISQRHNFGFATKYVLGSGASETSVCSAMRNVAFLLHVFGEAKWGTNMFMFNGDDWLRIHVRGNELTASVFNTRSLELGFESTYDVSTDVSRLEFCQMLPYPTAKQTVWGPKIGRVLARLPWKVLGAVDDPRGVALGMATSCNHIPFLNDYLRRVQALSPGVKVVTYEHRMTVKRAFREDPQTMEFIQARYGLTSEDRRNFVELIRSLQLGQCKTWLVLPDLVRMDA